MSRFIRYVAGLAVAMLLAVIAGLAAAAWWGWERAVPMQSPVVDYLIEPGSTPRQMALAMQAAGIDVQADLFTVMARVSGLDKHLKAGAYEARRGDTYWALLQRMANGDMTLVRLTFPEGWTLSQMRAALDASDKVRHDTLGMDDAALLQALNLDKAAAEGLFHPDTYVFVPGSSDLDILRRAAKAGRQILDQAWADRDPDTPLQSPYDALILASIIEKETGHGADRARVAGVFINRLRLGMPLQTDPTVIYGLGASYQGRLRKKDLQRDTPWNTYTRAGLPPTPIANPGKESLWAALHPERHDFLYFVSRGDGTSEFSTNLTAHNRAVAKYILNKR